MRVILAALLSTVVVLGASACSSPHISDRAVDVCGEGNVAYVDEHDGQYGCGDARDDD